MNKLACQFCLSLSLMLSSWGLSPTLATPTADSPPANLPPALEVPGNQPFSFKSVAKGYQIYTCQAAPEPPGTYAWTLKAPLADLFNTSGRPMGTHYAGPTWEADDKSKIVASVKARANAPDSNAIPWLLLEVKSHAGQGMFSNVNWIQRVNTVGGKAPTQPCDASQQNQEVRVPYSADYYFYRSTSAPASRLQQY
jgi:Protein of unknown function (DUF3455)